MLFVDNANFQSDAREKRMKISGRKHRLLDQDKSCFNGDEMNLLENIGRAILLTDPGKLTIFVIVPRTFVEPALWKRTISSMVYNRNDFSLQDFDYRV